MGFLEQIRTLDRLLHDYQARAALNEDPVGFVAHLTDGEDRETFLNLDRARLAVVADDLTGKIHSRWYAERFPISLATLARLLAIDAIQVVARVMAHPAFARREGEDTTGTSLFGAMLDWSRRPDLTARAPWLRDLLAYEYFVSCGLPQRSQTDGGLLDDELEAELLPGERSALVGTDHPGDRGVCYGAPCWAIDFDWPVSEIAEHLGTGGDLPEGIEPVPTRLLFFMREDRADELSDQYPLHELVLACCAPQKRDTLLGSFIEAERPLAQEALEFLLAEGLLEER